MVVGVFGTGFPFVNGSNSTQVVDVELETLRIPFHCTGNLVITNCSRRRPDGHPYNWLILLFLFALSSQSSGQDNRDSPQSSSSMAGNDRGAFTAKGEVVTKLDSAIWHVFQASNNDYWFGSRDQGVFRYDGKDLVRFTTKDGLSDNNLGLGGIQEDKFGNIYFNTATGISRFDGESFATLEIAESSSVTSEWKLQPDDLWFQGTQNAGVLYRYDGKLLYRLAFPKTKAGDDHYRQMPRDKFPNANFSPYDVYSIFKDSLGNVWFGTSTLGVCRFDGKSFAWLPESELRNSSFGARSIVEDKEGRFWFCNTLYRYEVDLTGTAGEDFKRVEGVRDVNDPSKELIRGIMSSTLDSSGALWMATYQDGVWRYDGTGVTHYPMKDGDKTVNTFSIYLDRQGSLWLGTQEAGAYKFNGTTFEKFTP